MTSEAWDAAAASFDDEPDHGLADPTVREAWRDLLVGVLAPPTATIADLGCGTGTLTKLLADEGHIVHGLDYSAAMLDVARAKAPEATFVLGDASDPALPADFYDVVLCRHVLWALPDPRSVVARWSRLLKTDGAMVFIEGRWHTGGGLTAAAASDIVRSVRDEVEVVPLDEAIYWGAEINDERYLLVSRS